MVKSKQRHIRHPPGKHKVDPPDEGDWMVVKKQRITILIPPLPHKVHSTTSSIGEEGHLQENPKITISQSPRKTNSHSQSPSKISPSKQPLHETEKSISLSPKHALHPPIMVHPPKPNKGMMIFDDSSGFINQRMRASYLERKLKKAGGLENWLVSLGLARFVKVFRRRNVNKFQLANITMKKLKDMGTVAVGPRRKLMHAIDCLCQPHCFQHV